MYICFEFIQVPSTNTLSHFSEFSFKYDGFFVIFFSNSIRIWFLNWPLSICHNPREKNRIAKNTKNIVRILNENNYSNEDCILIVRTILNKSKRLLNLIEKFKKVKNIEEVISNTKPPIFWKDKENVKKQINTWDLDDLKNKIYRINELETFIKNNSINSLHVVSDFIVRF